MTTMNADLVDWATQTQPSWAHDVIKSFEDAFPRDIEGVDIMNFVVAEHRSIGPVATPSIVGQWDHYAGMTWLHALREAPVRPVRMSNSLRLLAQNPAYYLGPVQTGMYFSSIDGRTWYSVQGNHRCIVGKFFLAQKNQQAGTPQVLSGVSRFVYTIDWDTYHAYVTLKQLIERKDLPIKIILKRHKVGQESCAESQIDFWSIAASVEDYRAGGYEAFKPVSAHLTATEFLAFAKWVQDSHAATQPPPTRYARLKAWLGSENDRLQFPGFAGRSRMGREAFVSSHLSRPHQYVVPQECVSAALP